MDMEKLFESDSLDGIADNVFGVVNNSVSEVKEMQRKKVAENVQLVVDALKKIESNISSRYDSVGNALEKRIITIKDGRDGADGRDGRNGKDGKNGRDGAPGPRGADGKNGLDGADGADGVSVTNAHIDFDGSLVISLSSGHEINVGEVVAPALAEQIKVITNGGGTSQSVIDTLASLQAQITAISGASIYKGLWNASTNTPTLTSSVGTSGNFYIVSVAGSTNLNGITNWGVGDWAIYNGTAWQRVEGGAAGNFTTVTASSLTSGRVTYASTGGLLADSAALTWDGTTLAATKFSGALNGTVGATTPSTGAFTTLSATNGLTVTKPNNTAAFITQTGATGYGLLIVPGADTVYDAFGINNAANTLNQIRMFGNGTATFAGGVGIGGAAYPGSTGLAVTGTLSATTTGQVGTTLGVGAATPSASGAGISFPATQSASTDANTLDDYEEGTWTPSLTSFTVVGSPTYTGFYTKVGRQVTVVMQLTATTIASSGSSFINNLPFSQGVTSVGSMAIMTDNGGSGSASNGYISGSSYYPGTTSATQYKYLTATYFTS